MTVKDWILLFVPILCNGVIVFYFQKTFENRQMIMIEKYKYVLTFQQKVDNALSMYTKMSQASSSGSLENTYLNNFISSYNDVFFYFQQNKMLLKSIENDINQLAMIHEQIPNIPRDENYIQNILPLLGQIFTLLQSIQNDCITHKI